MKDEGEYFTEALTNIIKRDEIYSILSVLINELADGPEIIVILDDYHYIKDDFINEVMEHFIKHSSYNMHYVIISREEIPMYLGDLRVNGEALDIEETRLRFSQDETMKFINGTLNLNVSEENIIDICKVSEGWIAGVQLIALVLKSNKDNIVKDIKGLNKYTVEYLTQEILKNITKEEKDFLIKTSILSTFSYDMCNDILKVNNSKKLIEALIAKNLFIIALDEDENIFRYHHIFKDFLNLHFCELEMNECKNMVHYLKEKMGDNLWSEIKNFSMLLDDFSGVVEVFDYEWVEKSDFCDMTKAMLYLTGLILKIIMLYDNFDENKREVFNLLREAFHYSIEEEYIKPFIQEKNLLFKIIKELKYDKKIELTLREKDFIKALDKFTEVCGEKDEILSEREKEVIEVLAEGLANKEIGERLNISLATVKTHIINIYSKLGVSNRVQAVEEWKRLRGI